MGPELVLRRFPLPAAWAVAALLVAIGVEGVDRRREVDTSAHQRGVRSGATASIPYSVGDWLGRDVPAGPAVVALLRPNVLVNRVYENLRTGETASLLFLDCTDARDLIGHYPPVCYPAHGQALVSAVPRDWQVGDRTVGGMRYRFGGAGGAASAEIVVDNFMVLPTGSFGRDMDAVRRVAKDPGLRRFGAGQVQVVTDGSMDEARRDEVLRTLTAPAAPLFRAMRVARADGGADPRDGGLAGDRE